MKKILSIILLLPCFLYSQSYNSDKNYKEIEKDNIRIVYPEELKKSASEILDFIDYQNKNNRKSVERSDEDFVIILHNDTTISNGFVTAGPFRGEFFGTPPLSSYELGANPWFQTLAIHEYRHALQMMHGRKGIFNKIMYFLGGEYFVSLGNVLAIPKWYWEGDAVSMETALSLGGRGRLNYFLKDYKAILLENDTLFSYEKAKNGSYKDSVPDHYLLGYLICSYGRYKYGYDFWKDIFSDATNYRYFLPLSKSLKEKTGLSSEEFYREAMKWWENKWEKEILFSDTYKKLSPEHKVPTDYLGAYKYKDAYISFRKKANETPAFVYIDKRGNEKIIVEKTLAISDFYDYERGYLLWEAFSSDKTNPMKDYSDIILYDIENKQLKKITKNSKYFAPALAKTKDEIVISEIKSPNKSSLLLIDFEGNILKKLYSGNYICNNPIWSSDDKYIFSTARNTKGEMALLSINVNSGEIKELIPFDNYIIESPYSNGDNIYFSATFDSVDDIYSYNLVSKEIKRLSKTKYGAYRPAFIDNELIFSEYKKEGYVLSQSNNKDYDFEIKTLDEIKTFNFDFFEEEGGEIASKVEETSYLETDYKAVQKLFNFHSWLYSYGEDELYLNLISTNETTDLNINFEYIHNFEKDKNLLGIGAEFVRYAVDFGLFYEKDNRNYKDDEEIEAKFSLPLNFTGGYYYRYVIPSLSYLYNRDNYIELSSLEADLTFSNMRKKAYMDPVYKNSQQFDLSYTKSMDKEAEKISLDSSISFEAFGKNDYIKLGLAYEVEDSKNDYVYTDTFSLPRGYTDLDRDNIIKASFDYGLPLFYPDKGIDGFYIKRITSALFYDYSQYELNNNDYDISSIGLEFYFDTSILSLIDLTIELRYSYRIDDEEDRIDFIIPLQYI